MGYSYHQRAQNFGLNLNIYGPLGCDITLSQLQDFFRLRKAEFVNNLGWSIAYSGAMEHDQYDLPFAQYCLAYQENECIGGARIMPTSSKIQTNEGSEFNYMLRDFYTNKFDVGFDPDCMYEALPVSDQVWEMSRFVSSSHHATRELLYAVDDYLKTMNVKEVLTISPVAFPRLLGALGFQARALSKPIKFEDREYVVLATELGRAPKTKQTPL